jgi:hypothetical protein
MKTTSKRVSMSGKILKTVSQSLSGVIYVGNPSRYGYLLVSGAAALGFSNPWIYVSAM